ncbi:hypothetical protein PG994_005288 [Apiospora phragmitis]|uniref:CFEM domain-containing protein n=1 Tax=Apiospora phragmitis TaxID=2905665 RepID=A0ABR1VBU2_9PEZI
MRLRHVVLAGTATSASLAFEMSSCVRSCYAATVYFLGCNPSDVACACWQQPNLVYYAEPCLAQECRDDDILLALTSMTDLCGGQGGGGGGAGFGGPSQALPPATQSPTSGSFSYKVGAPPEPTTIPGTTVVASGGSATRTIALVTIKAQQAPVTVTPPGSGSSGGGGGGSSVGGSPGKGAGVARGAAMAAVSRGAWRRGR